MAAFVFAMTVSLEFEEEDDEVAVAEEGLVADGVASTVFPGQVVAWGTPVIVVGTITPEGTEIWSILTTSLYHFAPFDQQCF
jgi:hypothetical protein